MTARKFTLRWSLIIVLLILFIIAFPYILPPLVRASGCEGIGGACGAAAMVFGIYLRMPVVIGVGVYLAILTWKRSRIVGAYPWAFMFVLLMYLASLPFLFAFTNFWATSFALGIVAIGGPLQALAMLLVTLGALSCLPESEGAGPGTPRICTLAFGGLALLFTSHHWLQGLALLPFIGRVLRSVLYQIDFAAMSLLQTVGSTGLLLVTLAYIASLAWWVIPSRLRPVS